MDKTLFLGDYNIMLSIQRSRSRDGRERRIPKIDSRHSNLGLGFSLPSSSCSCSAPAAATEAGLEQHTHHLYCHGTGSCENTVTCEATGSMTVGRSDGRCIKLEKETPSQRRAILPPAVLAYIILLLLYYSLRPFFLFPPYKLASLLIIPSLFLPPPNGHATLLRGLCPALSRSPFNACQR